MPLAVLTRAPGPQPRWNAEAPAVGLRVLVVGDDPPLGAILQQLLWDEAVLVETVAEPAVARALARRAPYDLIIVDPPLPGPDERRLCRRLRAAGVTAPVLVLSLDGRTAALVAGLEAGADAYLVAPVAAEELRAHLIALLRHRRMAARSATVAWDADEPARGGEGGKV